MACRGEFIRKCERRLQEIGPEGRRDLHHGSIDPNDWEPGLREYWNAVLDCVIEDWPKDSDAA